MYLSVALRGEKMSQGPFSQKVCLLLKISHNAMQLAIFLHNCCYDYGPESTPKHCVTMQRGRTRRSCKLLMEWTHYTTLSSLVEDFEASTIAGFGIALASKYSVTILCWSRNLQPWNNTLVGYRDSVGVLLFCFVSFYRLTCSGCCFVLSRDSSGEIISFNSS